MDQGTIITAWLLCPTPHGEKVRKVFGELCFTNAISHNDPFFEVSPACVLVKLPPLLTCPWSTVGLYVPYSFLPPLGCFSKPPLSPEMVVLEPHSPFIFHRSEAALATTCNDGRHRAHRLL